jgi:hypothetical protein
MVGDCIAADMSVAVIAVEGHTVQSNDTHTDYQDHRIQ